MWPKIIFHYIDHVYANRMQAIFNFKFCTIH